MKTILCVTVATCEANSTSAPLAIFRAAMRYSWVSPNFRIRPSIAATSELVRASVSKTRGSYWVPFTATRR